MKTLAEFFEGINRFFGVKGPAELLYNPWFIGICIAVAIYAFIKGWKVVYLGIVAMFGTTIIYKYTYPATSSDLGDLLQFVGCVGLMGLVLVYIGFIRE